jgi:hypothetical protein
MNRTGHTGRTDRNHTEILNGLRQAAIGAVSIASVGGGVPDLIAGFRGICIVLEVKVPGKKPNAGQVAFREQWPGPYAVVTTPEEAVLAVLRHAKECGKV